MPIDPNIALQGKPVQFDGAGITNALQHGLALRMQQEQHAQQMQLGALGIQQHQQALDQTKALNDAYKGALSVGPDGTANIDQGKLTLALGQGGHGSAIPGVLKGVNDFQKSTAELSELRGKVAVAEQDYAGNVGASMKAANNDPHLFLTTAQHAINAKAVDANVITPLMQQVQQSLEQDPTGESARTLVGQISDHFISQSGAQQKLINEGKTAQAAVDSAGARVQGAATASTRLNAELPQIQLKGETLQREQDASTLAAAARQGPDAFRAAMAGLSVDRRRPFQGITIQSKPEDILALGMSAHDQATTGQAAANAAETQNFHRQTVSQGAQRIGLASQANQIHAAEADPYGQLGVNRNPIGGSDLHGEEYLKTIPSLLAAKVRSVMNGEIPLPVARGGQLKGEGKALSDAVFQADPQFSSQRANVRKDFSPAGASGRNIQALNTATVHLDQLGEAAKALDNGTFRPGNTIYNSLSTMFGGSAPTNFAGIRAAVASEMATALKGSATDQEIHAIQTTIDGASSAKQLADIVNTHLHVLGAKLNTKSEELHKAIPDDASYTPVLPTASKVFEKHGISPINSAKPAGTKVEKWGYDSKGQLVKQ